MALITRGSIISALRPGVHTWYGMGYDRYKDEYAQIYDLKSSEMDYERDVNMYGLGAGLVKPEGTAVTYDTMGEGFHYNYLHVAYANGFIITHEAMMDNLYMKVGEAGTKSLGKGMKEAKEIVSINLLHRAFNSSYTFADGLSLCNTANLLSGGGTFSNQLAVAADISEAAIEQSLIDIANFVDDRSLKSKIQARKIIIPVQSQFEIQRILKSQLRVGTSDNDINVINEGSYLPEGFFVSHYLQDNTAWFIKTDVENGLTMFVREPVKISTDEEFNTDNILIKAYERYSVGCTDKRAIYGSAGV